MEMHAHTVYPHPFAVHRSPTRILADFALKFFFFFLQFRECVHDYKGFSHDEIHHDAVNKSVKLAQLIGGDGFDDVTCRNKRQRRRTPHLH